MGADALAAMTTILEAMDDETARRKTEALADPLGTFYRFTLPVSMLRRTPRDSVAHS